MFETFTVKAHAPMVPPTDIFSYVYLLFVVLGAVFRTGDVALTGLLLVVAAAGPWQRARAAAAAAASPHLRVALLKRLVKLLLRDLLPVYGSGGGLKGGWSGAAATRGCIDGTAQAVASARGAP